MAGDTKMGQGSGIKAPEGATAGELDAAAIDAIRKVFPAGSYFTFRACLDEQDGGHVTALARLIAWQLRQDYPHISYSGLKRVIFAADYLGALVDLGEEYGRTFATTSEPAGVGIAITENVPGGCIVVFAGGVAEHLLRGDDQSRRRAVAIICHELCHVSDETHKAKVLSDIWLKPVAGLDGVFLPCALALWNEYFANRHTSHLLQDPTETTGLLRDVLASVESEVREALVCYRFSHDLDTMMQLFHTKLRFAAQCVGYVTGLVHGTGKSIDELDSSCAAAIKQSPLALHWAPLLDELAQLNGSYSEWGQTALIPLVRRMQTVADAYGFRYQVLEGGQLYVDIPPQPWETYL